MNNEEAIKGLKEDIYNLKNFLTDTEKEKWQEAIDTVLNYIEELEKKNKDLCENYCPKYKELEEKLKIQTQNYNSAYEDINWFCDKYISKQKIKELKEKIHNTLDNNGITRAYQIKIDEYFEELLESEN